MEKVRSYDEWLNELLAPKNEAGGCGCGCNERVHKPATDFIGEPPVDEDLDEALANEAVPGKPANNYKPDTGGASGFIRLQYPSGYYSVSGTVKRSGQAYDLKPTLQPGIDDVIAFLKANPKMFIAAIEVESGESIIPNYDMEGGTGKKESGWLSTQRNQKLQEYFRTVLKPLVDDGTVSKLPEEMKISFVEAKTLTEPSKGWADYTTWARAGYDAANTEYTELKKGYDADQFTAVRFRIMPDLGENQCLFGLRIGIHYDDQSIGHRCNHARYEITANGVKLTTAFGGSLAAFNLPAGLPYASMNNAGDKLDDFVVAGGKRSDGGIRRNWFELRDKATIDAIAAAAGPSGEIVIRAKCVVNGSGWNNKGGCHTDAPHVYVYNINKTMMKGFPTYPRTNDGELVKTDRCGNLIGQQNTTITKSKDAQAGAASTGVKLTGINLNFAAPATGTLSSDQMISNKLNSQEIQKQADGKTYLVIKAFNAGTVKYIPGDVIDKVLPKGSAVTPAPGRV
jgi:hypothetical protein